MGAEKVSKEPVPDKGVQELFLAEEEGSAE
jgi:hypothetical protein